jgi:uncharacterized membrane protein
MSLLDRPRGHPDPTLTDRYLDVVAHEVPHDRREQVIAQLRASVETDVTSRAAAGAHLHDAEREALEALGDPRRVADEAAGPRWLVGPRVYPDYLRVLRLVALIALPIVAAAVAIASGLEGQNPLQVVGSSLAAVLNAAVMIGFWVTLVFAVLDRSSAPLPFDREGWTVADLPAPARQRVTLGETVTGVVFSVLLIAVVMWPWQYVPTVGAAPVPVLAEDLRPGVTTLLVAVLVAGIALDIVLYLRGHWTITLAALTTVLDVVFAGVVIAVVAAGRLFDPAFTDAVAAGPLFDAAQAEQVVAAMGTGLAWTVGLICAADAVTGWVKALRRV